MAKKTTEKSGVQPDGTIKYVSSGKLGTVVGPGNSFGIKCQIDLLEEQYKAAGYSEAIAFQKAYLETWLPKSSWGTEHKIEEIESIHPDDSDAICEMLTKEFNPRFWQMAQEAEKRWRDMMEKDPSADPNE